VHRWLYTDAFSEDDSRERLERLLARPEETGLTLAVERGGELIGDVSLTVGDHRQGEIGFIFHPDHQGRGYATEATRALIELGFGAFGLHRIVGRAEARNVASARVLEKAGMRLEAHLVENELVKGEWQSELVYAVRQSQSRRRK